MPFPSEMRLRQQATRPKVSQSWSGASLSQPIPPRARVSREEQDKSSSGPTQGLIVVSYKPRIPVSALTLDYL